jgi:hypothetical protein
MHAPLSCQKATLGGPPKRGICLDPNVPARHTGGCAIPIAFQERHPGGKGSLH